MEKVVRRAYMGLWGLLLGIYRNRIGMNEYAKLFGLNDMGHK